jgi:hypothetical protein
MGRSGLCPTAPFFMSPSYCLLLLHIAFLCQNNRNNKDYRIDQRNEQCMCAIYLHKGASSNILNYCHRSIAKVSQNCLNM